MTVDKVIFDGRVGFYQDRENVEEMEHIYPDPQPEKKVYDLGLIDLMQPLMYVPITFVINNKEGKLSYDVLKRGLELALGHYPWFAGRLKGETQVKSDNVWFAKADSKSEFKVDDKFNVLSHEFQFTRLIKTIVNSDSKLAPLFAAKATFVKDNCVVLSTVTCHRIADGETIYKFIRLWAEFTCTPERKPINPVIMPDPANTIDHGWSTFDYENYNLSLLSIKISLATLKSIQLETNKYIVGFVSKEDVFLALLWRIYIRIKGVTGESTLLRAMSIHSRKELNLGLGNKYVSVCTESLPIPELISKPIEMIIQAIRSAIPTKDTKLRSDQIMISKPQHQPIDQERDLKSTSHRALYESTPKFQHQTSTVHIHFNAPGMITIQPNVDGMMFATFCINQDLVPKFLSNHEVEIYGINFFVNPIN